MFLSFFFILMLLSVLLFTYGLAGFGDFLRALPNAAWFFKRSQARINAECGNSYQKKRELMKKIVSQDGRGNLPDFDRFFG